MTEDMNTVARKFLLGPDSRSYQGIFSRGANVYGQGSPSSISPNLRKLALRKLKERRFSR